MADTSLHQAASILTPYAVNFRYPGISATNLAAKEAIQNCRIVRQVARKAFGLPV